MPPKQINNTTIQLRRDTSTNWTTKNPILKSGEAGYDTTNKKLKIGDGVTNWNSLAYFTDIYLNASNINSGTLNKQRISSDYILSGKNISTARNSSTGAVTINSTVNPIVELIYKGRGKYDVPKTIFATYSKLEVVGIQFEFSSSGMTDNGYSYMEIFNTNIGPIAIGRANFNGYKTAVVDYDLGINWYIHLTSDVSDDFYVYGYKKS